VNAKRFFLSLILASAAPLFAQTPVWKQSANYPGNTSRNDDIHFIDEHTGWAASGGTGQIYKTTDGGKNWILKFTKSGAHFRSIGFVSATRGFAGNLGVGSYDGAVTDTNVLYGTVDGGETWNVVPGISETGMKGFCAFHVLDSQHIYGGGRVRGPAYFVKSENAGTNWTVVDLTAANVMGGIMDVYFKDATNGFAIGMDTNTYASGVYHGCIAKTTDGGATWSPVVTTELSKCYFWKMSWPTPQVGYASLQQNGSSSSLVFYKTTDGGNTWNLNDIPYSEIGVSAFYLQGIGFITPNEGWVGGDGSTAPYANNFLHTIDGGASWSKVGYNDTRRINRIRFLNSNFGYAAGYKLHIFRPLLQITQQPLSETNAPGTTVTLTTQAQGTPPLVFQWRFNGTNLSGANTNFYSITNFQAVNVGGYDLVVSDTSGSVTSAVANLSLVGAAIAPGITAQPQSQAVLENSDATFSVAANGTAPLHFQWRFGGSDVSGATGTSFTRVQTQLADAGNYSVVVTNSAGSVTSAVAVLNVITTNGVLFQNDFDSYVSPSVVTTAETTNGYKIVYLAAAGPVDFKAIFGFDYSTVTYPTSIPSAPNSLGRTTKGLFLTVNKDATGGAAAVNLYPTNEFFDGDFALKFDMWINWANPATSTEHTLLGINHSGNVTNRITQSPSDGLFFAVEGEDDSLPTSPTLRDYSVFRGGGAALPILMITNNTAFGPAPLLSPIFENYDSGFTNLFPSQNFPGYGSTPAGTAGLRWISGEIRQHKDLITWLLNGTIIAQYTNLYAYTNGNIMLGYDDNYTSIGDSNNFVVLDNIRVEQFVPAAETIFSPQISGGNFNFSFHTEWGENYLVQKATTLTPPDWMTYTNLNGNGDTRIISVPLTNNVKENYLRVVVP
jgi:photosystem II stability/assembly factor-like uncharacterized protein